MKQECGKIRGINNSNFEGSVLFERYIL